MAITTKSEIELESSFYGDKTILISKTGYGKSYAARVIIEEGIKKGHTFIIIDPQDAYQNLPNFEYINSKDIKSAQGLGVLLSQSNRNVVIMTKFLTLENQNKFLQSFIRAFKRHIRKGIQTLVIDEIHKFAPEGQNTLSKDDVRGLFQESRSDGLGIIGISQRPQRLDKTCLAQAEHFAVGRVTAYRDKESIKNYLDNPDDVEKLPDLEKGEFFFFGFGLDKPLIAKIRKAETKHSGDSPKNLLNEDKILYDKHSRKYVKYSRGKQMEDNIDTNKEPLKGIIPSMEGFKDLSMLGMKAAMGTAVAGVIGTLVAARIKSPIPVVSSRTLGGLATTITLYTGFRTIPAERIKSVFKYAAAGSAAFTVGSLAFDIVQASGFRLPRLATFALATATGAQPLSVEKSEVESNVDLNTKFA